MRCALAAPPCGLITVRRGRRPWCARVMTPPWAMCRVSGPPGSARNTFSRRPAGRPFTPCGTTSRWQPEGKTPCTRVSRRHAARKRVCCPAPDRADWYSVSSEKGRKRMGNVTMIGMPMLQKTFCVVHVRRRVQESPVLQGGGTSGGSNRKPAMHVHHALSATGQIPAPHWHCGSPDKSMPVH